MPEPFKLHFSHNVIEQIAAHLSTASALLGSEFDQQDFISKASYKLDSLELKARSNQIMFALVACMPKHFPDAASVIIEALGPASDGENIAFTAHKDGLRGWMMMPVTDYITHAALKYNTEHLALAFELLHECTQRFSAEFSIRPFLRDHPKATLAVLEKWAHDNNVHVRRLVSEGSRPYLPWGLRLKSFAKDPKLALPLLDTLKDDPTEYVRRSVANHLNDIAKDHPDLVASIATKWWQPNNEKRTKLLRHACRTLLKDGHEDALSLFGFAPPRMIEVSLSLKASEVNQGDTQAINVVLINNSPQAQTLMIDYAMHHQKASGKMLPKVFKWTVVELSAGEQKDIAKLHSFKPVTTRTYYCGPHKVEVLINGKSIAEQVFTLV